jgi:ribosomal 50S subunit-recycling heat shock protein
VPCLAGTINLLLPGDIKPEDKESTTMKSKFLLTALLALNIGLPAVHASEEESTAADKPAMGAASLTTLSATVAAVNQETREVTLKDAEGNEVSITVGEEVKNLPQVEVGDQVEIAYYESVNIEVLGPGQAELGATAISALETAEPGQKPAGAMTTDLSVVATIEAIDKKAETVTLTGPEGNTKTVQVRNPANLEKVSVGDQVMITLTRAVAVDVTEAEASE